jgi:phosphate transport system substrate-binding protein
MRVLWKNHCMGVKMPARLAAAAFAVLLGAAAPSATLPLRETGSTLLLPLMSLWVQAYQRAHTNVTISVEGTGSGEGIAQAMAGTADIGASDAYLSDQQLSDGTVLNIPLAVSAQVIAYHVPEIGDRHLNLTGDVLAGIYTGKIAFWDDARIRAINPQVALNLPHVGIVPIRRAEGSGDTFMFTQYLSRTSKNWSAGYGTTIVWPRNDATVKTRGNSGMVDLCSKLDHSIAYIAVSYVPQIGFGDLGYAALRAHDGSYALPTPESLRAAVAAAKIGPDGRASLIDQSGAGAYPIVTYEYAIVRKAQPDPAHAQALKNFFAWAISPNGGNDEARFLSALDFVPLPPDARNVSERLIGEIH